MESYLEHHGILGMKWGVRRYQNKDGTLTPLGRKRYLNDDGSYNETAKKELGIKAYTNEELAAAINRINLEKRYNEAMQPPPSRAKEFLTKALENAATRTFNSVLDRMFSKKDDGLGGIDLEKFELEDLNKMFKEGKYDDVKTLSIALTNASNIQKNTASYKEAAAAKREAEKAQKEAEKKKKREEKELRDLIKRGLVP